MKKVTFTVLAGLAMVAVLATGCKKDEPVVEPTPTPTPTPAPASLYTRLGGAPAITAVTDTFIKKVLAQPTLADNFVAAGTAGSASQYALFRERLIDQLCGATGGPYTYLGKNMYDAHHGMNITSDEFDLLATQLVNTLAQFNVPAKESGELIGIVAPMKSDIIGH